MKSKVIGNVNFYTRKNKKDPSPQEYAKNIAKECDNQVIVKSGDLWFGSVRDYADLARLCENEAYKDRVFYELLTGKQYLFADIDGDFEDLTYKTAEPYYKSVYEYIAESVPDFNPDLMTILSSSTKDKLSLHITYRGVVFENHEHQKPFWQDAVIHWEKHAEHMGWVYQRSDGKYDRRSVMDIAVYSNNRAMRAINCHKEKSDRVLVPVEWTDAEKLVKIHFVNTEDYFIGTLKDVKPFLYTPKHEHTPNRLLTEDMLNDIIDKIPNTRLKQTKGALFILENVGVRTCILGGEENTSDNCFLIWKKDGLHFGCHDESCCGKSMLLHETTSRNGSITDEPDYLCSKYWETMDEFGYQDFFNYIQKHCAWIKNMNCYMWKTMPDQFMFGTAAKFKEAFTHLKCSFRKDPDDDSKVSEDQMIPKWMNQINRREYDKIVWSPWTVEKPKGGNMEFNTFLGFNHLFDPEFKVDENKINPWVFHIENVLADEDKNVSEYLLNWLAHLVQKPNQKIGINIVIKSVRGGAGKDTFLDFFRDYVLGSEFTESHNDIDSLFKNFNSSAQKCVLTLLSEVGGGGAAYKNHNKLKDITTRKWQRIEKKGIDAYDTRDYNNYWMYSNDDWIVKMDETDRRNLAISCSTKYVGLGDHKKRYFNNLYAHSNKECGEHFFQYLCQRDISDFYPRMIPNTEWMNAMREKNYDSKMKALRQIYFQAENDIKIHSSDLMGIVNQYRSERDRYTNAKSFNCDWSKYTHWESKRVSVNSCRKVGFEITKDQILNTARDIMRNENFEFKDADNMDEEPDG